ncbi:LysE family translocator [Ruegeria sp. 1NDH52C]|uniref:LysE family translocator n=1 Tax=Ruegeria alba TaxID=2916756 RepID=A0ABS9NXH9_9RHOB|nr:LysE family transporter [Ruegeria alba]MCG6558920.1 LysE family translocator [Ruegeria alba]
MTPGLGLVVLGWLVAGGSPGPATLTIAGTGMAEGRGAALAVALGIVAGSASWGLAAALGMSALMLTHVWIVETVRYAGALYLLWLAVKSLRAGLAPQGIKPFRTATGTARRLFLRGYLIHLTNPKAILSWGAVFAIALPPTASLASVFALFAVLITASTCLFLGYALLFSTRAIGEGYRRLRRWFELSFALLFGGAALKLLTARLQ